MANNESESKYQIIKPLFNREELNILDGLLPKQDTIDIVRIARSRAQRINRARRHLLKSNPIEIVRDARGEAR